MTLEDAIKVKESLEEMRPHVEDFSWGPTHSFAEQRQREALRIIRREIKQLKESKWAGNVFIRKSATMVMEPTGSLHAGKHLDTNLQ